MSKHIKYSISLLLLASACGQDTEDTVQAPALTPAAAAAPAIAGEKQEFGAFEMRWVKPTSKEVASRLTTTVEIVMNRSASSDLVKSKVPDELPTDLGFKLEDMEGQAGTESLHVRYYRDADDLRVNNTSLQDDIESKTDVGETVARVLFEEAFQRLADGGAIDARDYQPGKAELSRTVTSWGSTIASENMGEVVNSYDFLARRSINGIPFVNQGVQISIHRSGRVARVRLGGARPVSFRAEEVGKGAPGSVQTQANGTASGSSLDEVPGGSGFVFVGQVDSGHYKRRFQNEFAGGQADRSGVMYMLPLSSKAGAAASVVEPMFVFSFSTLVGDIASRRQYIGYSLRDKDAKPVDLSERADPNATGDVRGK
jgi:hypothetical protein